MNIPEGIKFSKTHEWVLYTGEDTARIGISDYAQNAMGDIVFINLPEVGDELTAGEAFADMESVKAVEDVLSPVGGTVIDVNTDLGDSPQLLNEDPYGSWIAELSGVTEIDGLMNAEEYKAFCEAEDKKK